ncbi:zinc-binding alcohol dehydrogenase family protein [Frankia sp. CNm7]|uniref:Zinc-binding alcohol dehydrogenase family protein n=1 Tax=Frankia nepalensis TaxID=1836974 RepID=A0A937UTM7_9ACTN|nr:zinc-binding alcohol dehydrogenase family protein [Frankia nepalensis]MBL7496410.1 zinc-binding alcohol dehydrogenase family protein [Frankia nepalensis]MBL7513780.1 zinc-binding alcohol dehydrogenase family protein [Frankia nepalensis]MBL7518640.1 zinc-binding alcohol dehydrogenase family protein [Frankia nepalensis]MBL7630196.1 zinc-binding alcohol dehydrogenase family protein [Frankia nepalensis]
MSGPTVTRAVRLAAAGEPPRLDEQAELPVPGDDEVLVELDHAGVNPIDGYAAAGQIGDLSHLPRTLGVEGTGILAGTGTRVVLAGSGLGLTRDGTWAGAVVVPRDAVVEVPGELDPAQAGAIGTAAVTAYNALHVLGRIEPDDRVLVLGAGGGVGVVAVQLAKLAGASVVGQVGSPAKRAAVAGLGADRVVVAGVGNLAAEVGDFRPTLVVDPLGGGFTPSAVEFAAVGGRIVIVGVSAGQDISLPGRTFYRKGLSLLGYAGLVVTPEGRATATRALAADVVAGRLRIPVDEVVPLDRFDEAFARLRDRSVLGKVVLATQR